MRAVILAVGLTAICGVAESVVAEPLLFQKVLHANVAERGERLIPLAVATGREPDAPVLKILVGLTGTGPQPACRFVIYDIAGDGTVLGTRPTGLTVDETACTEARYVPDVQLMPGGDILLLRKQDRQDSVAESWSDGNARFSTLLHAANLRSHSTFLRALPLEDTSFLVCGQQGGYPAAGRLDSQGRVSFLQVWRDRGAGACATGFEVPGGYALFGVSKAEQFMETWLQRVDGSGKVLDTECLGRSDDALVLPYACTAVRLASGRYALIYPATDEHGNWWRVQLFDGGRRSGPAGRTLQYGKSAAASRAVPFDSGLAVVVESGPRALSLLLLDEFGRTTAEQALDISPLRAWGTLLAVRERIVYVVFHTLREDMNPDLQIMGFSVKPAASAPE